MVRWNRISRNERTSGRTTIWSSTVAGKRVVGWARAARWWTASYPSNRRQRQDVSSPMDRAAAHQNDHPAGVSAGSWWAAARCLGISTVSHDESLNGPSERNRKRRSGPPYAPWCRIMARSTEHARRGRSTITVIALSQSRAPCLRVRFVYCLRCLVPTTVTRSGWSYSPILSKGILLKPGIFSKTTESSRRRKSRLPASTKPGSSSVMKLSAISMYLRSMFDAEGLAAPLLRGRSTRGRRRSDAACFRAAPAESRRGSGRAPGTACCRVAGRA